MESGNDSKMSVIAAEADSDLMLLDLAECDRRASDAGKVTAIVATNSAPLPMLAWCIFSLLLRSNRDILHSIIVIIGGPVDDTSLGDAKQTFIDDLRKAGFPVRLMRVWGPVGYGHSEAIDSAVSWVRTQAYLLMHDDAILLSRDWEDTARSVLASRNVVMAATPGVFSDEREDRPTVLVRGMRLLDNSIRPRETHISFPHINTVFTLCRKDLLANLSGKWTGYNVLAASNESFANEDRIKQLVDVHRVRTYAEPGCESPRSTPATWLSMDIGSFLYAACVDSGLEFAEFAAGTVKHFVSMSWGDERREKANAAWESQEVQSLEVEIENEVTMLDIYRRHAHREP